MGGDWYHLIQPIFIGLILSFLLAKLISFVTACKENNLSISRSSLSRFSLSGTGGRAHGGGDSSRQHSISAPTRGNSDSFDGFADLGEVGSRASDDISVEAEKGSVGADDTVGDDTDDDWEGVESTELDEAFSAATAFVAASAAEKVSDKVSNDVQLQLYGLYKIATEGPCSTPAPRAFKMTARAKWQAWQKLGAMPPEDAMQKYVEIVTELFPNWADGAKDRDKGTDGARGADSRGSMGPVFSSFIDEEESGNELEIDPIHAFSREGDVDNLAKCINSGVSVNLKDSEGRTPLHWAVDRGHLNVIKLLVSRNADVNLQDNEGQTPLHYAVVCLREGIAEFLVNHNTDPYIKDSEGVSPVDMCEKNWPWLRKHVSSTDS